MKSGRKGIRRSSKASVSDGGTRPVKWQSNDVAMSMRKNGLARQRATTSVCSPREEGGTGQKCLRPAGAAVFVHDGLRRVLPPTDQAALVYRMKRID
jgi:hypothetical protein